MKALNTLSPKNAHVYNDKFDYSGFVKPIQEPW